MLLPYSEIRSMTRALKLCLVTPISAPVLFARKGGSIGELNKTAAPLPIPAGWKAVDEKDVQPFALLFQKRSMSSQYRQVNCPMRQGLPSRDWLVRERFGRI